MDDDDCDELMFEVAVMLEEFAMLLALLMLTLLLTLFEDNSSGRSLKKLR